MVRKLVDIFTSAVVEFERFLWQVLAASGDADLGDHAHSEHDHGIFDDAGSIRTLALPIEVEHNALDRRALAAVIHEAGGSSVDVLAGRENIEVGSADSGTAAIAARGSDGHRDAETEISDLNCALIRRQALRRSVCS